MRIGFIELSMIVIAIWPVIAGAGITLFGIAHAFSNNGRMEFSGTPSLHVSNLSRRAIEIKFVVTNAEIAVEYGSARSTSVIRTILAIADEGFDESGSIRRAENKQKPSN